MGLILSLLYSASYFLPRLYFGPSVSSVSIPTKNGPKAKESRHELLQTFIEPRCPSLLKPFRPAWWLLSGHLQVAYCVFGDFSRIDKIEYDRTLLRTVDGGTIGIDFTPRKSEKKLRDDVPIVVVTHGLTGACTPVEDGGLGYRGVVVNFRGCAGVPLTSPQLYSAGHTDDLRVAVYYIRKKYPRAPLIGVGFSLGACVLTRYLAEEGENSRLAAGCVLACPWDLMTSNDRLEGSWFHRTVYSSGMGQNLQAIVRLHAETLRKFTKHPYMTRLVGGPSPPFPMATAPDYYRWASCHDKLDRVRVPLLAISAADDPVVLADPPYEVGGNGWVVLAVTKKGGHLGWFEASGPGLFGVTRWVTKPILEWLRAIGDDMVVDVGRGKPLHEVDGFLKEIGRDDIGCIEIEGGGRVVGIEGEEGLLAGL
ncbi:hypothetical protein AcW1_003505 [Taiwanofungus camphoratus]|nr:hypothetical protein AcW1_003505 [Antrodia cinnamomea]